MRTTILIVTALMLSGCGEGDRDAMPANQPPTPTIIDADPTPTTGTGGETQTTSPDGTVNGAPGQPPAAQ